MWYLKFLGLWFGLGVDELGALLGFYSLDGLVWVWFRVGFPVFSLVDALWFGNVHVFFFFPIGLMFKFFDVHALWLWVCSLILGLLFDSGFNVVAGLWLLGFDDFMVLNFLGLWLRDLMILLRLKIRIEFLFWAEFFGFLCVFVSQ